MLSAVVFDADETLLDLRPAVTGGVVTVLDEMRRRTPAAAEVSLADLESDWGAVFGDLASAPVREIRRAALARSLARAGLDDHLDELAELFFARRFALTRPFAGVRGGRGDTCAGGARRRQPCFRRGRRPAGRAAGGLAEPAGRVASP